MGKNVVITCGKFDKYGRLLVRVENENIDIGKRLVDLGLAKEYII